MRNTNATRIPWLTSNRKGTGYLFDNAMVTFYGERDEVAFGHDVVHRYDGGKYSFSARRKSIG